jgi:hypothetical protein
VGGGAKEREGEEEGEGELVQGDREREGVG